MSLEAAERLFIGVPVPESTRLLLARQIPSILPGKPSPAENWHFTLRFLGATDAERKEALIDDLRATNFGASFDVEFDRLGAFPNPRRARVVWLGVAKGKEKLESVAAKAELAAVQSGFDPEARKFSAHLTVSRLRNPESVEQFLAKARKIDAAMRVEEVILYRSEIGGAHSKYSVIASIPLKP
jgi:2'-5' RNA ligase